MTVKIEIKGFMDRIGPFVFSQANPVFALGIDPFRGHVIRRRIWPECLRSPNYKKAPDAKCLAPNFDSQIDEPVLSKHLRLFHG